MTIESVLFLILWSEPYCSWFGERYGGLPADWVRQGVVTYDNVARCQRSAGIASAWAEVAAP